MQIAEPTASAEAEIRDGGPMRRPFATLSAVLLVSGFLSTGCMGRYFPCPEEGKRPEGLTSQDLVGSYEGSPLGTLTLNADGTLVATDWPHPDEHSVTADSSSIPEVRGTWKLASARGEGDFNFGDVVLELGKMTERVTGLHTSLYVKGSRKNPQLYDYAGDPDICEFHDFTKNN
ncbi:hypothetical protein H3146_25585 [Streptomyces sp. OF3]|uniref:Uncharacterized protein n=1 Tax=Streptomyces alkaliterrae TaxID=2213162 RepID=A0A7W3ZQL3_9ACTN|nr:hypothetical protein [Streptomyces alkaliterrae]MBB1256692.1 hypothetical protein [Streptomyces alkaliterrae]